MAEAEDFDLMTTCSVCREKYQEKDDDHTPRSLPCFHTICQKCLRRSLTEKSLACPICDQVHPAAEGVEKFPHNYYVITYMKRTKAVTKCKKHSDRKLSLYCQTADCQRAICELCLIKEHISHKVVDICEEKKKKKEVVKASANELTSELAVARENLLKAKNRLEEDSSTTLAILKERKKETIKLYNDMIKFVTDQRNTCNQEVEKEVSSIDSEVKLIIDIREGWTGNKTSTSLPPQELEEIQQIKNRVHGYLAQEKIFQYYKHNKDEYARENLEMRLNLEKIVVSLSDARNSNSSHRRYEVRPIGTQSFSSRSNVKRDEVRPIGRGSTSSDSSDKGNETKSKGTESTCSNSNEKIDELRPIETGSTSSSSSRERDGVRSERLGSSNLGSRDRSNEVRLSRAGSSNSTSNSNDDESYEDFVRIHHRKSSSRFGNANTILLKRTIADMLSEYDFDDDFVVFGEESEEDAFIVERVMNSVSSDNERKSLLHRSQWSWLYGGKGANKKEIKYTGDLTRNGYFGSRMPTA